MSSVIITVYTETPTLRFHPKRDQIQRAKPKPLAPKSQRPRTQGYDRRAHLLAHAKDLRHGNIKILEWPKKGTRSKFKKWRWPSLRQSLSQIFEGSRWPWRYERIQSDEINEAEGYHRAERVKRKRSGGRISDSFICRRMKGMLKKLSCAWKCKK